MLIFTSMDREIRTVDSIRYRKHGALPKHHLVAVQVIIHTIFKLWNERLLIDKVEVYIIFGGQLESCVSFDVI